jgi:hypothetical protein
MPRQALSGEQYSLIGVPESMPFNNGNVNNRDKKLNKISHDLKYQSSLKHKDQQNVHGKKPFIQH